MPTKGDASIVSRLANWPIPDAALTLVAWF
jgi:hypothetical protein